MTLSKPTIAAVAIAIVASLPTYAAVPLVPQHTTAPLRERLARTLEAEILNVIPTGDHVAASTILHDKVLSWHLRDLASTPSPHYRVAAVRAKLMDQVTPYPGERRLAALGAYACGIEAMQHLESALFLAVARYLDDHGDPGASVDYWTTPAARYLALSPVELDAAISGAQSSLDRLRAEARERFPGCAETRHLNFAHAELALASARSGDFTAAAGSLHDFLLRAGQKPAVIAIQLPSSES